MPDLNLVTTLQIVLGLGLLNVWLLRARSATPYRGGASTNLREEFAAYGLPGWFFLLVGALKVGAAVALLVGLWVPEVVVPAASVIVALMVGALAMHVKVQDPSIKSLPAFLMLAMSASLFGVAVG
jgi:hypothetical protein